MNRTGEVYNGCWSELRTSFRYVIMIGETSFMVVCFSLFLFNDKSADRKKIYSWI